MPTTPISADPKVNLWNEEEGFPTPGLNTTRFSLVFSKLPNVGLFANTVNLPALSLGTAQRDTRFLPMYEPGEKLYYEPFKMTFVIGSKMEGYKEIYDWMHDISVQGWHSDDASTCKVIIQEGLEITYYNIFPIHLGEVSLNATVPELVYPSMEVTFRCDRYTLDM